MLSVKSVGKTMTPNEFYKKYVTEEIKYRSGFYHPVKAGLFERILPRKINPNKLHPNPEDEFSFETVGPNWEIVNNYESAIRFNLEKGFHIFKEPLVATKIDKGGYMLLNGHHRWLAALILKTKRVPVKIVNITQEADIYEVINKSKRDKCVSIDLDEVLFADGVERSPNSTLVYPFNRIYKNNIRENASLLVKELNSRGYDIWVYTGEYHSANYINSLFRLNGCKVDGVVNGLKKKGKSVKLKDIFREKYNTIVHIDNGSITCVNTRSKDYEIIDLNANSREWAKAVIDNIEKYESEDETIK